MNRLLDNRSFVLSEHAGCLRLAYCISASHWRTRHGSLKTGSSRVNLTHIRQLNGRTHASPRHYGRTLRHHHYQETLVGVVR